jgi:hypothetical protein
MQLGEYVGRLPKNRIRRVLGGIQLLAEPHNVD